MIFSCASSVVFIGRRETSAATFRHGWVNGRTARSAPPSNMSPAFAVVQLPYVACYFDTAMYGYLSFPLSPGSSAPCLSSHRPHRRKVCFPTHAHHAHTLPRAFYRTPFLPNYRTRTRLRAAAHCLTPSVAGGLPERGFRFQPSITHTLRTHWHAFAHVWTWTARCYITRYVVVVG